MSSLNQIEGFLGKTFWPEGTKRHTVVYAVLNIRQTFNTGVNTFRSKGLAGIIELLKDRWRHGNIAPGSGPVHVPVEPVLTVAPLDFPRNDISRFEIESTRAVEETSAGVSVVIPVLNGSHDLLKLLPTLKAQKGFRAIEIIIVDSGSTDDTVQTAKEYGATVVEIPPSEFSHSGTRNLGAKRATREFLLFLTVDALPTSDTWLYELYSFLRSKKVAAVSCAEIPKADADLFTRVENWYHYHVVLGLGKEDRVLSLPASGDPASLRKSAQLSNVACLIPKDIFQQYSFRGEYAEDLDLGVRLISDGHQLGLLTSTKVIHSHTRHPGYYLKRGYIDKLTISGILNEPKESDPVDLPLLTEDIFFTLNALQSLSGQLDQVLQYPVRFDEFRRAVKEKSIVLSLLPFPVEVSISAGKFLDKTAVEFLQRLYIENYKPPGRQYQDVLLPGVGVFHDIAFQYMEQTYDVIDQTIAEDFQLLTYNYFMNLTGRYLGACYLITPEHQRKRMQLIHEELFEGKIPRNEKAPAQTRHHIAKSKR